MFIDSTVMTSNVLILLAVLILNVHTGSYDDKCISESHSDVGWESINVCFTRRHVQLLTCSRDDKLVIMDVVQRIKRRLCTSVEDCCRTKDSDMFKDSVNCEKTNLMFMKTLSEIMIKCNGEKFCTFLEPKSSIWPFIQQGKHANASHLKISYYCDNWPRYEMCGNVSGEVSLPFYISKSSRNHLNCSCDIYAENQGIFLLDVMELILGSDRESYLTIGNSTHKHNFSGGQDTLVLNRKLGSWSKVSVALVTYKRKQPVNILIKVTGLAHNIQLDCRGVILENGSSFPSQTGNITNEKNISHLLVTVTMFSSGFLAACICIGLIFGCIFLIKRKIRRDTALTYITPTHEETANETGTDSFGLRRNANDVVRQEPSQQDGEAEIESYSQHGHYYSQATKITRDTALTYITPTHEETANETGTDSFGLRRNANDVVRQEPSQQDGEAEIESDSQHGHYYSQAIKITRDTALTYITPTHEETANETGTDSFGLRRNANDVVRQEPSQQDGEAEFESDSQHGHYYSQAMY